MSLWTNRATARCQSRLVYIEENWIRESYFLALPKVFSNPDSATQARILTDTLLQYTHMSQPELAATVVMFAADRASVLQGAHTGVAKRVQPSLAPFASGMHYMAHRTNLAAKL